MAPRARIGFGAVVLSLLLFLGCAETSDNHAGEDKGGTDDSDKGMADREAASTGDEVLVRVVDVGAGLCCIIKLPGPRYVIYDAGLGSEEVMKEINAIIPKGRKVALLVLSHSDADHVGAVEDICDQYTVEVVVRPLIDRGATGPWPDAVQAIAAEVRTQGCREVKVAKPSDCERESVTSSGATFQVLCGWGVPPKEFDWERGSGDSEEHNAGSICAKLTFHGHSVLFTGDAVGRHLKDPDNTCISTEEYLVDHADALHLRSQVLIAPHHGSHGASSERFIKAVKPEWVIFSAGKAHGHPRAVSAKRYLDAGVPASHILRTDIGEGGGEGEWDGGWDKEHGHEKGSGDIDIKIRKSDAGWTADVGYTKPR